MTNNERFNAMLNSCQHPRAVYAAVQALAEELRAVIMELTPEERVELLAAWKDAHHDEG